MANPLSGQGVTDRDYAAAIGTAMGEALNEGVKGMAAVMDVVANRFASDKSYGRPTEASLAGTAYASRLNGKGKEFDAWNETVAPAAYDVARRAAMASVDPAFAATLPSSFRSKMAQAEEAAYGVFGSGELRGITKGATFYNNPAQTRSAMNGKMDALRPSGNMRIGGHVFGGPDFDPSAPFDMTSALDRNWSAYQRSQDTPVERATMANEIARLRETFRGAADYGPAVWDGLTDLTSLAAPVSPVFASSLPALAPTPDPASPAGFSQSVFGGMGFEPTFASPSISSDNTGFSAQPSFADERDGGFHGSTPQGFGGFGQSGAVDFGDMTDRGWHVAAPEAQQPASSYPPAVGAYDFTSMQPSAAMTELGTSLAQQYRDTAPSFPGAPARNTGWGGKDFDTSPSYGTIASDTTGTGQSFNQPTVPSHSRANPTTPAEPSKSYGPAPTDYGMGLPEDFSFGMPAAPAGFPELPPEVPSPVFAAPKAPPITPVFAAPPVSKPPAPIAPIKAPGTFSQPSAAPPAAKQDVSAAADFSTAFNSLWSPQNAAANRSAFSGMTGMNSATLNALTSAYDSGGMLTGAAYSGLMDAFNNPQPNFAANAVSPVFSSALPDITPGNSSGSAVDQWGGIVGSYTPGGGLYGGSINDAIDSRGGIPGSYSAGGGLFAGSANEPGWSQVSFGGWGGGSHDGTNPGLR